MSSSTDNKKSAFSLTIKDYPKLTVKPNYLTWAKAWQWVFKSAKLWTIVNGIRKRPEVPSEGTSTDTKLVEE